MTAVLAGRYVALEPVAAAHHDALWAAAGDGTDAGLWDYLPYGPWNGAAEFSKWLTQCQASSDPRFFAIVPRDSGAASGMLSLLRDKPEHRVIEVGHVWLGASLQRTTAATEAVYLVMQHVFEDLGYRRFEWKCNALNERSVAAARRYGFTFEGTFRQHMIVKGENRDTSWLSLLDSEWPEQKRRFERWLDPGNFGPDGAQLTPLR